MNLAIMIDKKYTGYLNLLFKPIVFFFSCSILVILIIVPMLYYLVYRATYNSIIYSFDSRQLPYLLNSLTLILGVTLFIVSLFFNLTKQIYDLWRFANNEYYLNFGDRITKEIKFWQAVKFLFNHPIKSLKVIFSLNKNADQKERRINSLRILIILIQITICIFVFFQYMEFKALKNIFVVLIFINISMIIALVFSIIKTFNGILGVSLEVVNIFVVFVSGYVAIAWGKLEFMLPPNSAVEYSIAVQDLSLVATIFTVIVKFFYSTLITIMDTLSNLTEV